MHRSWKQGYNEALGRIATNWSITTFPDRLTCILKIDGDEIELDHRFLEDLAHPNELEVYVRAELARMAESG